MAQAPPLPRPLTPCCRELLDSLTLGDYLATRPPRAVISITAAEGVGAVLRRFACAGLVSEAAGTLRCTEQAVHGGHAAQGTSRVFCIGAPTSPTPAPLPPR